MNAILAIETSSGPCSVALEVDGAVDFTHVEVQRAHARVLLPTIAELLAARDLSISDLGSIIYGQGPGSFTGLRIGCAVVQGLSWAHDVPALGVSSLETLAERARFEAPNAPSTIVAVLDARMDELYLGAFRVEDGGLVRLMDDQVCAPSRARSIVKEILPSAHADALLVGDGLDIAWPEGVDTLRADVCEPDAMALLRCGHRHLMTRLGDARTVQPVYLRDESRWRKQAPSGP